jgi:hypothetical protein
MKHSIFLNSKKLLLFLLVTLLLIVSGCGNKLEDGFKSNSKEFSVLNQQIDALDKLVSEGKEQKKPLLYKYHLLALKLIEQNSKFTDLEKEVEKSKKPGDDSQKGLIGEYIKARRLKNEALIKLQSSYERNFLDFNGFLSYTLMIYNNSTLKSLSDKEKVLQAHPFEQALGQKGDKKENLSSPIGVNKKEEGVINSNDIKVHAGPGANFDSLGVSHKGDAVKIIETIRNAKNETWHKVEFKNPKAGLTDGWVQTDFITTR